MTAASWWSPIANAPPRVTAVPATAAAAMATLNKSNGQLLSKNTALIEQRERERAELAQLRVEQESLARRSAVDKHMRRVRATQAFVSKQAKASVSVEAGASDPVGPAAITL